jgi:hypothetical protein
MPMKKMQPDQLSGGGSPPPMRLQISPEKLREQITNDPDVETDAGTLLSPQVGPPPYTLGFEDGWKSAMEEAALRGRAEPGEGERLTPEIRDRDALWCKALIASLSVEAIERVTKEFNELRAALRVPDAQTEGQ